MPGRLVCRDPSRGGAYDLGEAPATIGRAADNKIVLTPEGVSRYHAAVRWNGEHYVIEDLGSKNGTWLNGERLSGPQRLEHGDTIAFPAEPALQLFFEERRATKTVTFSPEEAATQELDTPTADVGLRIDLRKAEVWLRGLRVNVTAKEYLALSALSLKNGALVRRQELAEQVWPEYEGAVSDENIEQLISRLRRKLEDEPERPRYLLTVRGLGYRLVLP